MKDEEFYDINQVLVGEHSGIEMRSKLYNLFRMEDVCNILDNYVRNYSR